jgi:hypothetical protein
MPRPFTTPRGVPVPRLPDGLHLGELTVRDRQIHVDAVLEEWKRPIVPAQLQELDSAVRSGASDFDLSTWVSPRR